MTLSKLSWLNLIVSIFSYIAIGFEISGKTKSPVFLVIFILFMGTANLIWFMMDWYNPIRRKGGVK